MQKITIFALVAAVALVAAALVGVGFAQLTIPNPTAVQQTLAQWWINTNPDVAAPYCYNDSGTTPAYCINGTAAGYCASTQAQNAYGYGAQACNQLDYGNQAGYGYQSGRMGNCGRVW